MHEKTWRVRWSPTLGELESTAKKVWGTDNYNPDHDQQLPTVFFGVYGLPDFYTVWRHKGRKAILWAGSDIKNLFNGYWLADGGSIKVPYEPIAKWLNKYVENYCENTTERDVLDFMGIRAKVVPSYLGEVKKIKVTYQKIHLPKVYASVSGDNFKMYGWDVIEEIAPYCDVRFYLYGNKKKWKTKHKNVIVRGRVDKEVMNEEISQMQAGIRPLRFDGFSEILCKSVLMGQYPISKIKYKHIDHYYTNNDLIALLNDLKNKNEPNLEARNYYLKTLNKYPWNKYA